ncbi:hypothetical protein BALCAV_0214450 [Alkalihalobacillus alcalophilus ATCC 27647 = CGMCC 1.3604]|uniref:Uncharacterized protein n=1 Tax=Alkalihalobacillus alcalophilus ATCC 27647 = CGMCC 1.3604 TaxID=1218173 RepID=A0A094WLG8_ALKAL|nr:hypothetical protein BALCAV_0214450 [Alkalihalobacillus alcalophilus ATCC 27647 = CGMCC 1.3604]
MPWVKRKKEDYGSVELYCEKCNYHFEMEWEMIWDIQECTIGFIGYQLNDTFISCEKCGSIISEETDIDTNKTTPFVSDSDLPF